VSAAASADVICDAEGNIVAMSLVIDPRAAGSKFHSFGMQPRPGQHKLTVSLEGPLAGKTLRQLHEDYRVDLAGQRLRHRDEAG
jgi:hypothetical protein